MNIMIGLIGIILSASHTSCLKPDILFSPDLSLNILPCNNIDIDSSIIDVYQFSRENIRKITNACNILIQKLDNLKKCKQVINYVGKNCVRCIRCDGPVRHSYENNSSVLSSIMLHHLIIAPNMQSS